MIAIVDVGCHGNQICCQGTVAMVTLISTYKQQIRRMNIICTQTSAILDESRLNELSCKVCGVCLSIIRFELQVFVCSYASKLYNFVLFKKSKWS